MGWRHKMANAKLHLSVHGARVVVVRPRCTYNCPAPTISCQPAWRETSRRPVPTRLPAIPSRSASESLSTQTAFSGVMGRTGPKNENAVIFRTSINPLERRQPEPEQLISRPHPRVAACATRQARSADAGATSPCHSDPAGRTRRPVWPSWRSLRPANALQRDP